MVRLGDAEVEYDPGFKLYLATSLPNPHYLPEVCIKVNLVDFSVTQKVTRIYAGSIAASAPCAAPCRHLRRAHAAAHPLSVSFHQPACLNRP